MHGELDGVLIKSQPLSCTHIENGIIAGLAMDLQEGLLLAECGQMPCGVALGAWP